MGCFSKAISVVLANEGGYCDIPADKGGPTNMGITQADVPSIPIQSLTEQQASDYYYENYWKPFMAEIQSQAVTTKLLDMSVLLGISTAVRLLQRALGFPVVSQDGDFGPETLACTNDAGDNLLPTYKNVLADHFTWIVQQDSSQQEFLNGWLNRVNS